MIDLRNFHVLILFFMGVFTFSSTLAMEEKSSTDSELYQVNYEKEQKAALHGQDWYEGSFIPTKKEVKGGFMKMDSLKHIKIRLPVDLKRILDEHKEEKKPISLAVSCGDQELPWRAFFAARTKNSSAPQDADFWNYLGTDAIDYSRLKENFISLDPLLGIDFKTYGDSRGADGRGAGHIIMDAQNKDHWKQLSAFLKKQGVTVSQIIFTAMGNPENTIRDDIDMLKTHLDMLAPGGRLVSPYFFSYDEDMEKYFFSLRRDLFNLFVPNGNQVFLNGPLASIFQGKPESRVIKEIRRITTPHGRFLKCVEDYQKDEKRISKEIETLISEKYSDKSNFYQYFLHDMALYYIAHFDWNGFEEAIINREEDIPLKASLFDQLRFLAPLYIQYFKALGYNAYFLTNPDVAKKVNLEEVKAQKWKPGDYPYGERHHIALIIEKS